MSTSAIFPLKPVRCIGVLLAAFLAVAAFAQAGLYAPGSTPGRPGSGGATDIACSDCARDSDGDGVVDSLDQCPRTEAGAPVTLRGCPHDSDGDGHHDHHDRCANSDPEGRVDARGCELGTEIALPDVVFTKNAATLNRRATRALDDLVATLETYTDLRIEIAGYTDSRGRPEKNLQLSKRRAEAVRGYLVAAGIAAARVTANGYGAANPISDNDTEWGRARNRRVVARVLGP